MTLEEEIDSIKKINNGIYKFVNEMYEEIATCKKQDKKKYIKILDHFMDEIEEANNVKYPLMRDIYNKYL